MPWHSWPHRSGRTQSGPVSIRMSLCGAGGTEVLSREGQRSPPTCEPPWRAARSRGRRAQHRRGGLREGRVPEPLLGAPGASPGGPALGARAAPTCRGPAGIKGSPSGATVPAEQSHSTAQSLLHASKPTGIWAPEPASTAEATPGQGAPALPSPPGLTHKPGTKRSSLPVLRPGKIF